MLIDIDLSVAYLNMVNLLLLFMLWKRNVSRCQDMLKPDVWHVLILIDFFRGTLTPY